MLDLPEMELRLEPLEEERSPTPPLSAASFMEAVLLAGALGYLMVSWWPRKDGHVQVKVKETSGTLVIKKKEGPLEST